MELPVAVAVVTAATVRMFVCCFVTVSGLAMLAEVTVAAAVLIMAAEDQREPALKGPNLANELMGLGGT